MCIGRNLYRLFFFVISLLRQTVYPHWHALWKCDEVLTRKLTVSHTAHGITKQYWWHVAGWSHKWGIPTRAQFPEAPERFYRCLLFRAAFLGFYLHAEDQNCICWITVHYTSPVLLKYTEHGTHRTRNSSGQHDSAQCICILCGKETVYWLYVVYERRFTHRATNRSVRGFVVVLFFGWENVLT